MENSVSKGDLKALHTFSDLSHVQYNKCTLSCSLHVQKVYM